MEQTPRERIADMLRRRETTPTQIAEQFDRFSPDDVVEHIRHIADSVNGTGEQVLVSPPVCRECGFDSFATPANRPSQCPECRATAIEEPEFTIQPTD